MGKDITKVSLVDYSILPISNTDANNWETLVSFTGALSILASSKLGPQTFIKLWEHFMKKSPKKKLRKIARMVEHGNIKLLVGFQSNLIIQSKEEEDYTKPEFHFVKFRVEIPDLE